jgi:hypothetical protein
VRSKIGVEQQPLKCGIRFTLARHNRARLQFEFIPGGRRVCKSVAPQEIGAVVKTTNLAKDRQRYYATINRELVEQVREV